MIRWKLTDRYFLNSYLDVLKMKKEVDSIINCGARLLLLHHIEITNFEYYLEVLERWLND